MRITLLIALALLAAGSEAQVRQPRNSLRGAVQDRLVPSPQAQESLRATIREVETALRASPTASWASSFAPTVQLALPGLGRGDYSANQAAQLLSGFFSRRPVTAAAIEKVETAVASPFASGVVVVKGDDRDTLRLYLSFATVDARWLITHLSLY